MGKARKDRNKGARSASSPTIRPLNPAEIAANNVLRESKILPVVKNLGSTNPKQRLEAVHAINNLLEDKNCRRLLLKERVVQKLMEEMLNDSNQEVVVYGWGALRNIAAEEGYDQSIFMYRRDILTPAIVAINTITSTIGNINRDASALNNAEKKLLWQYAENVVGLITGLCETNQEVVDSITKLDILHFVMSLLGRSKIIPASAQEVAAQCLHALTEENFPVIEKIVGNVNYLSLLMELVNDTDISSCLKTIFICGVLHNISLAVAGSEEAALYRMSDSVILPILTTMAKSTSLLQKAEGDLSLTPLSLSVDQRILALQTTLEILASIATAVQENAEGEFKADEDGNIELIDEDGVMKDDGDDNGEVDEQVLQDMEMVVGDESNTETTASPSADIVRYLVGTTSPVLLSIAQPGPGAVPAVQVRALSVLNNISWTTGTTITEGSSLWPGWVKLAHEIWESCVTSILRTNTADIELADAIAGLSWAIAKSLKGSLDVSHGQHQAFINLYHAANSDELRTKCVGVLGCLGLPQGRIKINKEIGVFMMTLITGAPNSPANPTVEALNAIFDIYADAEFDYDTPTFVNNSFLAHLTKALPNVRITVRIFPRDYNISNRDLAPSESFIESSRAILVKRIDKKKLPEDRHRADEAVLNLQRFIKYKTKERTSAVGGSVCMTSSV